MYFHDTENNNFDDSNGIRTHNHLVHKRTPSINHLANTMQPILIKTMKLKNY